MGPLLHERAAPLATIAEAVAAARAGNGSAVLVTAGPGVGRSAVLDAAVRAAGPGVDVVRARADEMEASLGLSLLAQLLPTAVAGDDGASAASVTEPSAPYLRALATLERRSQPLLIAVDDLHWADVDSLRVLAFLARRLGPLPVALVATLRPWPPVATEIVTGLTAHDHARRVSLVPLSRDAARHLLEARTDRAITPDEEQRTWALCRGNPALTVLAAEVLRDGRELGDDLTDAVHPLRAARFAGLDPDALRYARCASVMGEDFRPEIAVTVAGLSVRQADQALQALHRSRLVADAGHGRARFAQPLVARLLYDELAPALRRRLHARTFEQLQRHGYRQEAVEHALRADLSGDDVAVTLLERVGRSALRDGAVAAAVRQLDAAVRFRGDDAAAPLLIGWAEALCAAGEASAGAAACRRALDRTDLTGDERIEALTLLGRCDYLVGTADRGAAALERAVVLAASDDPDRAVVALLDHAASAWAEAGSGAALPLLERAHGLAVAGDVAPRLREQVEVNRASTAVECGDRAASAVALAVGDRILDGARTAELTAVELVSPMAAIYPFAHVAQYTERLDDCLAALELARERIERAGAANALAIVTLFVGHHLLRRGRLVDALDQADRAARFSELTPVTLPIAAALRALALAWTGRTEESAAAADGALSAAPQWWLIRLWTSIARGIDRLWAGDGAASDAFLEVEAVLAGTGIVEPNHTLWFDHAVAAHLLADRVADAERVITTLESRITGRPGAWPPFALALGRARVAAHRGDEAAAIAGAADALVRLGDLDLPLPRVEAQTLLGGLLRRAGRAVEARPHLADAVRVAEACDARPLATAAATELRLARGRRRPVRDRDRLTPAELRVAQAAAEGFSNAEIARALHLSVNTVATHLRRTYAKLGITGRGRLAGADLSAHADRSPAGR